MTTARASRFRGPLSIALLAAALATAVAGGLALYARSEIVDQSSFADRAVEAAHQPALQRVIAREIAVQLVEPAFPDVVAARPVVESAVKLAIGFKPFESVIRLAARHGQRLLFERGAGNAVFDVADAGTVVSSALRALAPRVAREIPRRTDAVLLAIRRRSFAAQTLRFADHVRTLGIVLPIVALLLLALSLFAARDRRAATTRSAVAFGVTGILIIVAFELLRRYVVSHVYGIQELTNADVRAAIGALWDTYLGDLLAWMLVLTAVAWLIAAASASLIAPYSATTGLKWLQRQAVRPPSRRVRPALGAIAFAVGAFFIVKPTLALRAVAVVAGGLLVYLGVSEVLIAIVRPRPSVRPRRDRRRPAIAIAGVGIGATIVVVLAFLLTAGAAKVRASPVRTCNGYAQLCGRRLDEVAVAGTHNAMSAADSPGWLIANQDRRLDEQLRAGVRLFKISSHYGIQSSNGRVVTDIAAEGSRVNRIAEQLSPAGRQALQRLSRSLAPGTLSGRKRDLWLCHSACELGATNMVAFLTTIAHFLASNSNQVVVLFDEDYVGERDLQNAFKRAGLFKHLASLQPGQPLPTLGDLIRSRRNVVVFAQEPTSGKYRWDTDAFKWIQDTPLGAEKPGQFTCKLYRGRPNNPLLMMNDWADIFPPRPTPNLPLVKRAFILGRARQCVAARGMMPNLILTDYYNRGDVVGAAAELNGVAGQRPAPLAPWS